LTVLYSVICEQGVRVMNVTDLSYLAILCGVRVARSLVFCLMFCRSLFDFPFFKPFFFVLSYFCWPLCCLSFFYLRFLVTSLVSSNLSYSGKCRFTKFLCATSHWSRDQLPFVEYISVKTVNRLFYIYSLQARNHDTLAAISVWIHLEISSQNISRYNFEVIFHHIQYQDIDTLTILKHFNRNYKSGKTQRLKCQFWK
jgi:hypothetical protein